MQESFEISAEVRTDQGKGASRRLRHANGIPAIVYGGGSEPQTITLKQNELAHHLENEAFYSHVLSLKIDGKTEKVIMRDLQRHPCKAIILHADFLRVDKTTVLTMNIPLHCINEENSVGVKAGGMVSHLATEIEVACLSGDLPEYLEVDLSDLDIGDSIHLSQIPLPKGVEIVALTHGSDHDLAVVNIHKPRGTSDDDDTEEGAPVAPTEEGGTEE